MALSKSFYDCWKNLKETDGYFDIQYWADFNAKRFLNPLLFWLFVASYISRNFEYFDIQYWADIKLFWILILNIEPISNYFGYLLFNIEQISIWKDLFCIRKNPNMLFYCIFQIFMNCNIIGHLQSSNWSPLIHRVFYLFGPL